MGDGFLPGVAVNAEVYHRKLMRMCAIEPQPVSVPLAGAGVDAACLDSIANCQI